MPRSRPPTNNSLTVFIIVGFAVSTPAGILLRLYHMKRTPAFAADASVQTEANPYSYRTIGKEKEVFIPLWIITARSLAKMLERQQTLTAEDRKELEEILNKANALLEGQYVGLPEQLGVRRFPITEDAK